MAQAHFNLGNALRDMGKSDAALPCYCRARELAPNDAAVLVGLGCVLRELGRLDEAITCFRQSLEIRADFVEAHNNLGNALYDQAVGGHQSGPGATATGSVDDALPNYRRALELEPDRPETYHNFGAALKAAGQLDAAIASYRRALELQPDLAMTHYNLGNVLTDQGNLEAAILCYGRALELEPEHAEAKWNQSLAWLLSGDFASGWPGYECRWKTTALKDAQPRLPQPRWNGARKGHDTVLLIGEQGFGDTLQFIRYAPLVKQHCRTVFFLSPAPLVPILSRTPGVDRLLTEIASAPPFDAQVPLLSVPSILGTRVDNIPANEPYLFADPELVASWADRLRTVQGFRIGINWRGRPGAGAWQRRDLPLSAFSLLAAVPSVQLISLQRGATSAELAMSRAEFSILDFGDELDGAHGAFMDTAAIMMNLDLVITSDTAVPHLAGGLGVPVWVMLPFSPDWRWLLHRTDTPWYPTTRLFRQPGPGDWQSVFAEVSLALGDLVARRRAATSDACPPPAESTR
jgi:Flp pilus assembly protein TadD